MARAILKCTQHKNKWAVGIFEDWRPARFLKVATLQPGGPLKDYGLQEVQSLEVPLVQI